MHVVFSDPGSPGGYFSVLSKQPALQYTPRKEVISMPKILQLLLKFLSPALLKLLYYQILAAEKSKQPGPEKQRNVIASLASRVDSKDFVTSEMASLNEPDFKKILPILIHTIVQILNLLFGKNWIENKDLEDIEGSGDTPISPKP